MLGPAWIFGLTSPHSAFSLVKRSLALFTLSEFEGLGMTERQALPIVNRVERQAQPFEAQGKQAAPLRVLV